MNPFRLFGFVIYIIFEILYLISGGRRGYYRMRLPRISYQYYNGIDNMPQTDNTFGLGATIRSRLRRKRALKTCSKFCSKVKYVITLKNTKVTIIFDDKNKTLSCFDNTNKERSATIIWQNQVFYVPQARDNIFEQTFDDICFSFSDKANYKGILDVLKNNFDNIQESKDIKTAQKIYNSEDETPIKIVLNKIDINTATIEEISKLPGINIVLAKRIVKYRDLKSGIKSKEEFYKEFKIKEHFQNELNKLIVFSHHNIIEERYNAINKSILNDTIKPAQNNDNNDNGNGERIIDF